jgi:GT2 family glycosyltransferase
MRPIGDAGPRIDLVVASYRRPDALATLLSSLARQTLARSEFHVSVVVDGLDEFEAEYRKVLERGRQEQGLAIDYLFQANAGQSAARNRGIARIGAPLVCVVDDDMDLAPGFLAGHVEALEVDRARTVAIGRVIPEEGWERGPLYEAVRTKAMLEMHEAIARGLKAARASAFVTQNVSFPRNLFQAVGGFDEKLRLGEDTELGLRFELAGARFVFAEQAAAVHRSRVGSYETWMKRQVEYGRLSFYIFETVGGNATAHPLRNLVNGSRLNALAVHALCWSDALARGAIASLRRIGEVLQRVGLVELALATHKAIQALSYHLGVKQALGSWGHLLEAKRAFVGMPGRPLDPT